MAAGFPAAEDLTAMPGPIRDAFTSLKERALEASARAFINRQIEKLGVLTKLEIDCRNRAIRGELDLRGEQSPIVISVGSYDLSETDGASYIVLHDVNASREWITALLCQYLVGQKLKIPQVVRIALQP
jgi:hypothetical protein